MWRVYYNTLMKMKYPREPRMRFRDPNPPKTPIEKLKNCTSYFLAIFAILSLSAFLVLIPLAINPAISTIRANYDTNPITCVTIRHIYAEGATNCNWSSCREGCTATAVKCHQFFVNYTRMPFNEWQRKPSHDIDTIEWDVSDTKFSINSEGCGYPPEVNCTKFAEQYGYANRRRAFPCYYSRVSADIAIEQYSWEDNLKSLILSLIVPTVILAASISILSYWHCRKQETTKKPAEESQLIKG